jgi:Transposase DDE domain
MTSLPQVSAAFQRVLNDIPDDLSRAVGFCQRRSKLTGARFVQTLVFGWWHNPVATLAELCQSAAALGVSITPQGLDQRFGPAAAALLRDRLTAATTEVIAADPVAITIVRRFTAVEVLDSTTIRLPDALASHWRGCGGRTTTGTQAALKCTLSFDLVTGRLTGPELTDGRTQDRATTLQHATPQPASVHIVDQGFATLTRFAALAAAGAFFLSRLPVQWSVWRPEGERLEVEAWLAQQSASTVEIAVELGAIRLPARVLALRVPPTVAQERRRKVQAAAKREGQTPSARVVARADWTLLVTNIPAAQLTATEAWTLYRCRWQIELLFKRWKSLGGIDESRSADPDRILCEVYAKLLIVLAQHWVLLTGCWPRPDRSLAHATVALRAWALPLALHLGHRPEFVAVLTALQTTLACARGITKRRRVPATYQRLADPNAPWGFA